MKIFKLRPLTIGAQAMAINAKFMEKDEIPKAKEALGKKAGEQFDEVERSIKKLEELSDKK